MIERETLEEMMKNAIKSSIRNAVETAIYAEVREMVGPMIRRALDERQADIKAQAEALVAKMLSENKEETP